MIVSGLVSVVIPVYNGEKFIRNAIDSVLSQSHANIEVVVINDGAQDNSSSVVSQYGDPVRLIEQENAGVAAARNVEIAEAGGEFVAFLDQDDCWTESKLELQLGIFTNPNIGLVHTQVQYFDWRTGAQRDLLNPEARSHEIVGNCKPRLLLGNGMYNSSVMVRKALLNTRFDISSPFGCGRRV